MNLIEWLSANYAELLQVLTLVVVCGEMITRLTPTKADDGFVHRIGRHLDHFLDLLKVPNLRKKIESSDDGRNP